MSSPTSRLEDADRRASWPLSPRHPLEGLENWARYHPRRFNFASLEDHDWTRERRRVDAATLRRQARHARDALAQLASAVAVDEPLVALLVFPPGMDFLPALLGCFASGAVAVPAYPPDPSAALAKLRAQLSDFDTLAHDADARIVITTRAYAAAHAAARARIALANLLDRGRRDKKSTPRGRAARRTLRWISIERLVGARDGAFPRGFDRVLASRTSPSVPIDGDVRLAPPDPLAGVAFVQYTSGSTSSPKGVLVGHAHLTHNCALIRRNMRVTERDVNASWLPQYHDMGLVGGYLAPLTIAGDDVDAPASTTCVFASPGSFMRDPTTWPLIMSKYRATMTQAPDFAYRLCAERWEGWRAERWRASPADGRETDVSSVDLSSLRRCLNASERVQPDTSAIFARAFEPHGFRPSALVAGYGLAECVVYACDGGAGYATIRKESLERERVAIESREEDDSNTVRVASCGAPCDEVTLVVVDRETRRAVPDGFVGEVWIRSDSVAFGYQRSDAGDDGKDEDEREGEYGFGAKLADDAGECGGVSRVASPGARSVASRAYLRTGDEGFLRDGELFLVGRSKDLIVVGGRNVAPQDVERVVADAGAGRLRPGGIAAFVADDTASNPVVIVVAEVRDGDPSASSARSAAKLVDDVRVAVAASHGFRLDERDVRLVRARTIPKTTSGKLRRRECRRAFLDGELRSVDAIARRDVEMKSETSRDVPDGARVGPFPDGADSIRRMIATKGRDATKRAATRALVTHVRTRYASPRATPHGDLLADGALDSRAAVELIRDVERDVFASDTSHIHPAAIATNARTLAKLASVVVDAACPPNASASVASNSSNAPNASNASNAPNATKKSGDRDDAPAIAWPWTVTSPLGAVVVALVCLVLYATPRLALVGDDGGAEHQTRSRGFGRPVDRTHARLAEWIRVVFPFQLVVAAAIATLRRVDATDLNPTRRHRRAARFAVAHVVLSHGVPTAAALLAAIVAHRAFLRLAGEPATTTKTKRILAWVACVAHLSALNMLEPAARRRRWRFGPSRPFSSPFAFAIRGCLGNTTFDGYRAARYCALRALSSALDAAETVRDENDADANSLDAVVAYVLHPATYQAGPLVPFATFRRERLREGVRGPRPFAFGIRIVAIVAWCATCALLTRIGYVPAATFHGARFFADDEAAAAFEERLLPFGLTRVAHALAFLTVAWATSHVVFGVPWAVSTYVDGIFDTPCDVPAFWTSSASSFRRHWSAFHVSLSSFYFATMYAPLGSGHVGIVVVIAFSTLFHGFETRWLVWGAVNAAGLTIERLIDDSYPGWRFASRGARLARACDGTVATCATVAMFVGDGLDAKAWAWVVAWIFAGFVAFGAE